MIHPASDPGQRPMTIDWATPDRLGKKGRIREDPSYVKRGRPGPIDMRYTVETARVCRVCVDQAGRSGATSLRAPC